MYNRLYKLFFYVLFLFLPMLSIAQDCALMLNGQVIDSGTGLPLEFVNLQLTETLEGTTTDSTGFFEIPNLCAGDYHIVLSHIGCESQKVFIQLDSDTTLSLSLDHSINDLHHIEVTGKIATSSTQRLEMISEQDITDNANENLSNLLESIVGVSTLKNGSGISKPVVHGLYGNRLTILNNGIAQSGQQWGNDHSPEIDPLVANKIKVIKGTSALEYAGGNLGSIVMIEPKKIIREPHLHGRASYFFETNGNGNGLNIQIQKYASLVAWKINGTIKKSGDKNTPDYFLNNTGSQEANLALQLEKSFDDHFSVDLYASTFNTELGVLRGSHIGNLTDLEEALTRDEPFFTEEKFSYQIDAPKQKVNHHLLKIHSKYFIDEVQWIDITLAGQLNNRKEFDVRRSGRIDIPALSLLQSTIFAELKYQKELHKEWTIKSGIQYNNINNTNNPETGILPLVPDYLSNEIGSSFILSKALEKAFFDIGVRYDFVLQNVATISSTLPREIIRYQNNFHNINSSLGYTYSFSKNQSLTTNVGFGMRNPAINELYSAGLHQGVSGIEEGDVNLKTENAIKGIIEYKNNVSAKLSFETLFYYHSINDYIFLKPQDEIRLTIRGAFPVFKYEQTNAEIYGVDFASRIAFTKSWYTDLKYSFIKGNDRTDDIPLVNIPANNLSASLVYQLDKTINIKNKQLENFEFEVSNKYVFKQNNLLADQDFIPVPDAYNLLGMTVSSDLQLQRVRLRFIAKVDNILNTNYRDYLNRQRYFADDLGINASFTINVKF